MKYRLCLVICQNWHAKLLPNDIVKARDVKLLMILSITTMVIF